MPRATGEGRIGERASIHEKDVEPAVVVEVQKQPAGSHDLREVLLLTRTVDVGEIEPGGLRDVAELRMAYRRGRRARRRLCRERVVTQPRADNRCRQISEKRSNRRSCPHDGVRVLAPGPIVQYSTRAETFDDWHDAI